MLLLLLFLCKNERKWDYVKRSILAEINEEIEDGDDYPLIVKLLAKIEELEKQSAELQKTISELKSTLK